jgi:hypothetical protein
MTRFLPIAAVALLAGSAARAQTYDISDLTPRDATVEVQSFADSFIHSDGRIIDDTLDHDSVPITTTYFNEGDFRTHDSCSAKCGKMTDLPAVDAAPEFHPAGAIAALTLLLCGVAVLKGWRRE